MFFVLWVYFCLIEEWLEILLGLWCNFECSDIEGFCWKLMLYWLLDKDVFCFCEYICFVFVDFWCWGYFWCDDKLYEVFGIFVVSIDKLLDVWLFWIEIFFELRGIGVGNVDVDGFWKFGFVGILVILFIKMEFWIKDELRSGVFDICLFIFGFLVVWLVYLNKI